MFAVSAPVELVLSHRNRTTADGEPATGGLGSGHDVVSVNDTSGPLEFEESLTKYAAARRASEDRARLWFTLFVPFRIPTNAVPSAPMINASIVIVINTSTSVNPCSRWSGVR